MACGFSLACGCFVNCFWTVADRFSLSVSRCVSTDCREIKLWPCEQIYDDRRRGEGVSQSDCVLLFLTFWSFRVDHRFSFSVSRCVSTDCRETQYIFWDRGNRYMMTEEVEKDIRKAILQLDRGRKETKFREGAWKKPTFFWSKKVSHFFRRIDILCYTFLFKIWDWLLYLYYTCILPQHIADAVSLARARLVTCCWSWLRGF